MRRIAFAAMNLLAAVAALPTVADDGFAVTNYFFDAKNMRVGVASPAQANEPRMYLLLCDPGATAETLQAANVPAEVSNWWHVVYCADKSTGDAERDFKRLMDVYDAGVGRGFSPRVFKTAAVTPSGKALERRFLSVPRRPKPEQRSFRSKAVDAKVAEVTAALRATGRDKLALMFENCYPNTIDTTVCYRKGPDGDDETFVYTGDIPAMWLRDSAAQVWPYLRLVKDDDALRRMIRGVVLKQFELIRLDPYANAFNDLPPDEAAKPGRIAAGVQVKKVVWERKYELDSLCYPIRLAHGYWKASGDGSVFDARWLKTLRTILAVMREQQHKTSWKSSYFFACPAVCNNAIENNGWGRQVKPVGLIASSFRPSDDATQLPFLVPSNLMAADVLGKAAEILEAVNREKGLADECRALKAEVEAALARYAVRAHPTAGRIYAFEVDGFGSALFMDDANIPSLIAIPYFTDIPKDDPVYRATRAFVWSEENPWFFRGKAGEGIGGPHCGHGSIWPMSVILKGLTTDDPAEMNACLDQLEKTDAGTSFIHESHDKDDASQFSRTWFAWANTLFGELVLKALECGRLADGFWYSRDHEPAGGVGELLGSYVAAGRIAGVVSVLSDADGNEQYDCAGWARNYGRRRCDLMTPDTVFAVFSMTKTFTGAAIMCAIDEGKMSLDDEVAKYLPEFASVKLKNGAKPKRPLTIRDLTSHVTGFRACGGVVDRDLPLREVARRLAKEPLEAEPGETFAYGNAWIDAAAACLEIAVGEPYECYLQRKVLDPLGMKDTTFWPTADQLKRLVAAYTTDDTPIRPAADDCARQLVFPKKAKIFPSASGGLFSTPRDMVRFSQMLAHHGERKGVRIISRKIFDTVFAVKQTPPKIKESYSCGCWIEGDWMGHEGAMRTDQRANLRTGQSRVFFIQTENRAGSAFFQLKRAWDDMTEDNSKEGGAR